MWIFKVDHLVFLEGWSSTWKKRLVDFFYERVLEKKKSDIWNTLFAIQTICLTYLYKKMIFFFAIPFQFWAFFILLKNTLPS